jgi:hypothetical protein
MVGGDLSLKYVVAYIAYDMPENVVPKSYERTPQSAGVVYVVAVTLLVARNKTI